MPSSLIGQTGRLTQVHDGDTISVMLNGAETRIRILGIQAMEIHPFEHNIPSDYYADEATARLSELLGPIGSTLTLSSVDKNIEIQDRLARHVIVQSDGQDINVAQMLIEEGYVLPFPHETESTYNELYMRLGEEAKEKALGLWANADNVDIAVNFDAEGDDEQNLSGEWIKLTNTSSNQLDISGWVLRDSGLNMFVFPDATIIKAGQTLTIHGGNGTNTSDTFYWGNERAFLDNFGDGVFLHENLSTISPLENGIYSLGQIQGASLFPCMGNCTDLLQGKIAITANYDADGDDNININGEWVEVVNISDTTVNLQGYQIHSEPLGSDHYYFEESTPLKAGEKLYLHVGSGTDTDLKKYWGKETGILANSEDRVWIDTLDGILLAEHSWPESNTSETLSQDDISELYVAIFNRASEREGNEWWRENKSDLTTAQIADEMLSTSDAKEYFGSSLDTNQAFVEHIYLNTLNKTMSSDPSGISYWTNLLDKGTSRGEMVAKMIDAMATYAPGAQNYDASDSATVSAYNQFANRVEVSNYVAEYLNQAPSDYGTSLAFDGDLDVVDLASTASIAKLYIEQQLL